MTIGPTEVPSLHSAWKPADVYVATAATLESARAHIALTGAVAGVQQSG